MANTIQLKRSSTASDTPSASDLAVGELAVNTADAKLFTKHTDNSIKEIAGSGGGGTIASQDADSFWEFVVCENSCAPLTIISLPPRPSALRPASRKLEIQGPGRHPAAACLGGWLPPRRRGESTVHALTRWERATCRGAHQCRGWAGCGPSPRLAPGSAMRRLC